MMQFMLESYICISKSSIITDIKEAERLNSFYYQKANRRWMFMLHEYFR